MSDSIKYSVIIVNYNTSSHLRICLQSIIRFKNDETFEIIVVDNNSTDREIINFPDAFPEVKFYFLNTNNGFGAGCNYGSDFSKGKYIVFVNPDIIFEKNILSKMHGFMESNEISGICSPVFINFNEELVYTYNKFPNLLWEFNEFRGKGNDILEKNLLNDKRITGLSAEPMYVDCVTGACLMIRRDLFEEIGKFDEDFFLYYEDTDLQYRVRKSGFEIALLPFLRVKHFVNSSVKSDEGENIYYFHLNKSKLLYYYKNHSFLKRNILRILMVAGLILRILTVHFRKRYKGKEKKKIKQYRQMVKIYFSQKKELIMLNPGF